MGRSSWFPFPRGTRFHILTPRMTDQITRFFFALCIWHFACRRPWSIKFSCHVCDGSYLDRFGTMHCPYPRHLSPWKYELQPIDRLRPRLFSVSTIKEPTLQEKKEETGFAALIRLQWCKIYRGSLHINIYLLLCEGRERRKPKAENILRDRATRKRKRNIGEHLE